MRVLICSNAYPPNFVGGAELMAHEQAKALAAIGHDVRVFAGDPGSSRHRHSRMNGHYEGIPVCRIATTPEDYSPEFLNFLHPVIDDHFKEILQDFRPDIVHCHNLMGLSAKIPLIARKNGIGSVCTLHDFWGFCLRNTAIRTDGMSCDDTTQCRSCLPRIHDGRRLHVPMRFRKDFIAMALDQIDRFIAPSHYIARRYVWAGMPEDRLAVIPNGVDLARFQPIAETRDRTSVEICYVGYLGTHKGVATLIDAFALLPRDGIPSTLQLIGEGPERDHYLARIYALGLQDRVRVRGKIPPSDMPQIYAQSDIVVLPSIWDENQPVCLMEAMAAGRPIIASRRGGIPELIGHGVNGFMFEAGNAPDLAVQLSKLIGSPQLRHSAGIRGRQRVAHMGHHDQAHLLVAIYAGAATASKGVVHARSIYTARGALDRKSSGESASLNDRRHPSRYFIPSAWIEDALPARDGILLMGRVWSLFYWLRITPIIPLPRALVRVAHFIRGRFRASSS
jgi:glycosyltransferase involved in cell wall biosynthesis